MFRGIGRYVGYFIIAIIVIAAWRASNGDLSKLADGIWMVLDKGANFVTALWNNIAGGASAPATTPAP
jgi:hypothetical protein